MNSWINGGAPDREFIATINDVPINERAGLVREWNSGSGRTHGAVVQSVLAIDDYYCVILLQYGERTGVSPVCSSNNRLTNDHNFR
ncbi:hypothetical protein ACFL6U_31635 [Planctomycetota bacterium]